MNSEQLMIRFRELSSEKIPLSGAGETSLRLIRLMDAGQEDLSLAKLIEAHWDAVAILSEAGLEPAAGATYGVWAAEIPGTGLSIARTSTAMSLRGTKPFCSGSGLIDRALITVFEPEQRLVDVNLRENEGAIRFDGSTWRTTAFAMTQTATATFTDAVASESDLVGGVGWYLSRPGFWHGALGPAACWVGGAEGLVDYARRQKRSDAHTLAHLGAMEAAVWAMKAYLQVAADEIDAAPDDVAKARRRALTVRHLVEGQCTDILRRLTRAYGPHPLVADAEVSRRYMELDLYLRQTHAERDLEALEQISRA
jgi:alkylation response protein AidB-like acyl-CoA dehydrogenase